MKFETIRWEDDAVVILDQTQLPAACVERVCTSVEELHAAIKTLAVRGAPLLGVAAAFGVCLGVKDWADSNTTKLLEKLAQVADYIKTSRPTAVNLFWALDRMLAVARTHNRRSVAEIRQLLLTEAQAIKDEDVRLCRGIGEHGVRLIESGDVILTHCNAGALATAGMGTALAPVYVANKQGKRIKVFADETRPLLQGARLTAWELEQNGIDVTVLCDNMAASLMAQGRINKILVGADRVAANGDAANKIGTYALAVLAQHHQIPLYVAVPYSSFDFSLANGTDIPIEQRPADELKTLGERQIVPDAVATYNPAFDVTPHTLITAFITERGIFYPPFEETLKAIKKTTDHRQQTTD